MPIKNWSTTAANNNSSPPFGAPEGMTPSAVNDVERQIMADTRTQFNDAEWFDYGDSGVSRASATTFKITSDVTARYLKGRRIKCYDSSTLYGTITASSYSAPDTTITLETDSGSLSASLSSVALAILTPTSISNHANYGLKGSDVASASTVDLSAIRGDMVDITGTTTITAFGTVAAGVQRIVRFTGILTLTHNATSLILPGAANITTAANDTAILRSLGSGNWLCIHYKKADGTPVVTPVVTPSAGSTPFTIAGNSSGGAEVRLGEDTDNGSNYIALKAAAALAANRTVTFPDTDISVFFVNRGNTQTSAAVASSTTTPADDTIPQITEGVELMTLSYTPKNSSNILVIMINVLISGSSVSQLTAHLHQDATASALATIAQASSTSDSMETVKFIHVMTAGTTSATTFRVRAGASTGNITMNGFASNRKYGGTAASSLHVFEFSA
jgi:hypothetical protein